MKQEKIKVKSWELHYFGTGVIAYDMAFDILTDDLLNPSLIHLINI